ncbi:MAG: DUF927 domain-containing protein [Mesorhizobium sp.]|nr:DUF927 domain-containing protein [Mesorhizobium sp.]
MKATKMKKDKKVTSTPAGAPSKSARKIGTESESETHFDNLFKVLRWRDHAQGLDLLGIDFRRSGDGRINTVLLEMSARDTPSKIASALLDRGASLPEDKRDREQLISSLIGRIPATPGVLASRSGWHSGAFLLGRKEFGASRSELRSKVAVTGRLANFASKRGLLSEWTQRVAKPARHSSIASFTIMAALAAPLSRFAGLDEGVVFGLCGPSSTGKTTALQAAQSVLGPSVALADWNLTDRALDELAAAHSDLPLVLDDLERFRASSGNRASSLSGRLHKFTGGQSTMYAATVQPSLPMLEWQGWALSSSPRSLRQEFALNRREPSLGDLVRWIDLVVEPAQQGGIWDLAEPNELAASAAARSEELKVATGKFYGTAMRKWIRHLVAVHETLPDEMSTLVEFFVAEVCPSASGVERRIARKIGVVYAAGVMARSKGILPWKKSHCLGTCRRIFERARQARQEAVADVRAAHARFLSTLRDGDVIPVVGVGERPQFRDDASFVGYRQIAEGTECLNIRQSYLEGIYGASFSPFLAELRQVGALLVGHGGKTGSQVRVHVDGSCTKKRVLRFDTQLLMEFLNRIGLP